ncbi:hypothetical protein [Aneurinibacillus aneurinilyticus]|uniref:Uncharacterized protein n=1 Tax=Aneurinibacillus aneurinilyticus TaxID=1391 RepID=A0A848CZW5_ANEAE|nr:hypothetical protein [Aneurinibacillus aneurinilyticus]NME98810.1 hypothetical protein [Aneurinibacillus aneurinilyticus]
MIIQYDPEWIVTTPCPNGRRFVSRTEASRAAFCLSQAGLQNIWVDAKRETIAVLFHLAGACAREAQMFCRSGPGATKRPCLFLVRKRRGNTPTRAPSFFHLMDNQQVCINMSFFNAHANHQMLTSIKNTGFHV